MGVLGVARECRGLGGKAPWAGYAAIGFGDLAGNQEFSLGPASFGMCM